MPAMPKLPTKADLKAMGPADAKDVGILVAGALFTAVKWVINGRHRRAARASRASGVKSVGGSMPDKAVRLAVKEKQDYRVGMPTCVGCPCHSGVYGVLRVFGVGGEAKMVVVDKLVLLCTGMKGRVVLAPGAVVSDWGILNFVQIIRTSSWDDFYSEAKAVLAGHGPAEKFDAADPVADRIRTMLPLLETGTDEEKLDASKMLGELAETEGNRDLIANLGGIEPLVGVLRDGSEPAKEVAAWALINTSFKNLGNQERLIDAGAVPELVSMLASSRPKAQKGAAGALMNLSSNNDARVHSALAGAGVITVLTDVLESGDASVQERSAGVLRNLAGRSQEGSFVGVGGDVIVPLVLALGSPSEGVQEQAAGALRNLAAQGEGENKKSILWAGGVPPLVRLLSSPAPRVQEHAAGAVKALSVEPLGLREPVVWAGALRPLVRVLSSPSPAARTHGVRALATLFAKRTDAEVAEAVDEGMIPVLVGMLGAGVPSGTQEAAAIVLGEVAHTGETKGLILGAGGGDALRKLANGGGAGGGDGGGPAVPTKVKRAAEYAIGRLAK